MEARDKGGFGHFEMLKPRGTDRTTAQKTRMGVPEHLRSSSSSKVDAHTTLRAVSAIPAPRATASNRRAPRTPAFNNASEPPHIPHTIACSSARTHPNRPRSWADSTGPMRTSIQRATSRPTNGPDTTQTTSTQRRPRFKVRAPQTCACEVCFTVVRKQACHLFEAEPPLTQTLTHPTHKRRCQPARVLHAC